MGNRSREGRFAFRFQILNPLRKGRWRTATGKCVRIRRMETRHLRNTIAMLHRWNEKARSLELRDAYQAANTLQGQQAIYAIEEEIDRLEGHDDDPYYEGPWDWKIAEMEAELLRRGEQVRGHGGREEA